MARSGLGSVNHRQHGVRRPFQLRQPVVAGELKPEREDVHAIFGDAVGVLSLRAVAAGQVLVERIERPLQQRRAECLQFRAARVFSARGVRRVHRSGEIAADEK